MYSRQSLQLVSAVKLTFLPGFTVDHARVLSSKAPSQIKSSTALGHSH
jgi:hypothetical protein